MVNPGAFTGSRKEFLLSQKDYYAAAANEGNAAEAISSIQRRYFVRYPVDIPHDVEPSEEHLASVDDEAAVPEPEGPNPDVMTLEEYEAALASWEDRQKLVLFRKAQIKRWFAYELMKDMDLDSTQTGLFNPYRPLLFKLTGKKINVPRQRSAANTWRKTQRDPIEAEVQRRLKDIEENEGEGVKKQNMIAFRDQVAREMFGSLTEEEQRNWLLAAIAEQNTAMKAWKAEMEAKPATDPKSRQVAIQGLVKFMQPILDLVCDATGFKASFICGGPEPAQNGQLNVISIHSGVTSGDVKMSFGRAERAQFRKMVVPLYGSFLQKCYTPVECRARALGKEQGFVPLADLDLENDGASVDSVSQQPPPIRLGTPLPSAPSPAPTSTSTVRRKGKGRVNTAATTPANQPAVVGATSTSTSTPPSAPTTMAAPAAASSTSDSASTSVAPASAPAVATTPATSTSIAPALGTSTAPAPASGESAAAQESAASAPQIPLSSCEHPVSSGEVEVDEEDGTQRNPFPFDFPLDFPLPVNRSTAGDVSCHPSPLPSPFPSPRRNELSPSSAPTAIPAPQLNEHITLPTTRPPAPAPLSDHGVIGNTTATSTRRSTRGQKDTPSSGGQGHLVGKSRGKRNVDKMEALVGTSLSERIRKRPRTSDVGTTEPVEEFEIPDNAPAWFKKAFAMLTSADLGKEWTATLGYWGRFEVEAGYLEVGKLGGQHRPGAVGDWIQRARSPSWRPKIRNAVTFGGEMKKWWGGLQPGWRVLEDGTLSKGLEGDFEGLRKPGTNGLLSVATGLLFWGNALKDSKEDKAEWLEVVLDFQLVLSQLVV